VPTGLILAWQPSWPVLDGFDVVIADSNRQGALYGFHRDHKGAISAARDKNSLHSIERAPSNSNSLTYFEKRTNLVGQAAREKSLDSMNLAVWDGCALTAYADEAYNSGYSHYLRPRLRHEAHVKEGIACK
jgi:hypothetical protein